MLAAIREVVERQQAFLEPHLTLQDVADRCGYGRTYISALIKEEMGGFSAYVNRLRLAYVEEYQREHPDATLGEAIDMAGFGSRPTCGRSSRKNDQSTPDTASLYFRETGSWMSSPRYSRSTSIRVIAARLTR